MVRSLYCFTFSIVEALGTVITRARHTALIDSICIGCDTGGVSNPILAKTIDQCLSGADNLPHGKSMVLRWPQMCLGCPFQIAAR